MDADRFDPSVMEREAAILRIAKKITHDCPGIWVRHHRYYNSSVFIKARHTALEAAERTLPIVKPGVSSPPADPYDAGRIGALPAPIAGTEETMTPEKRAFWDAAVDFMNRRVKVEDELAGVASGKRGPIEAAEAKALTFRLGVPTQSKEPVEITYTNWRGETSQRTIIPRGIWFGSTEWHPEPQWLLRAFDVEKQAQRDFALKDFGTPP